MNKIYAIFDDATKAYMEPWFVVNAEVARRAFHAIANDKKHPIGQSPKDYTLFELGEWDPETGTIKIYDAKTPRGCAIEYVEKTNIPEEQMQLLFDKVEDLENNLAELRDDGPGAITNIAMTFAEGERLNSREGDST